MLPIPNGWIPRRRFLKRVVKAGVALVVLPMIPRWARAASYPETARAWRSMGTLIEVRVPDLPPADAIEAIRRVRARIEELDAAMTLFRPESPLVALNASREGMWLHGPSDLTAAIDAGLGACRATEGAFDPSVAPALKAWGLYDLKGRDASADFLRQWKSRPAIDAVQIDAANARLRRLDSRVELDLGGIGKGIAVDAAMAILGEAGSRAALVNLGGEIGVLGAPENSPEGWPVGIAHPRKPGEFCAEFSLRSGHVATSGDYERWVETSSGRKHHILDPRTAEPVSGVASITVWRPSGTEADIASTASFVSVGRGVALPDRAFLITCSGETLATFGNIHRLAG